MAAHQRSDLFAETANRMGLAGTVVEKDFWVCWVLKQLFSIEAFSGRLLFKGGTSLSKIFRAINRFSEDIDLAVDYEALGFTGIRDSRREGLSRTRQNKLLAAMMVDCQRYIGSEFISEFRGRCEDTLGSEGNWSIGIDDRDPNIVRFHYPAATAVHLIYISPQVVLELGTHAEFIPRDDFSIRPFAAEQFPGLFTEAEVRVTALLAKRTFWEKATILHAQYHRAAGQAIPARYSRHYYDVAMLCGTSIKEEALADLQLLRDVVRHKQTFYPAAWARYDLAIPGTLKLVPGKAGISALKQDYREMAAMIFGDPPRFERVIGTLTALEGEIDRLAAAR
jgi:Nucleotidyl transferase AbiEii toxin, Type IV TA system